MPVSETGSEGLKCGGFAGYHRLDPGPPLNPESRTPSNVVSGAGAIVRPVFERDGWRRHRRIVPLVPPARSDAQTVT
jgi:hypothetical protein